MEQISEATEWQCKSLQGLFAEIDTQKTCDRNVAYWNIFAQLPQMDFKEYQTSFSGSERINYIPNLEDSHSLSITKIILIIVLRA